MDDHDSSFIEIGKEVKLLPIRRRPSSAGFQMLMESGDLVKPALFLLLIPGSFPFYLTSGGSISTQNLTLDTLTPCPNFFAATQVQTVVAHPFSTEIENDRGTFAGGRAVGRGREGGKLVFPLLFSKDGEDRRTDGRTG